MIHAVKLEAIEEYNYTVQNLKINQNASPERMAVCIYDALTKHERGVQTSCVQSTAK